MKMNNAKGFIFPYTARILCPLAIMLFSTHLGAKELTISFTDAPLSEAVAYLTESCGKEIVFIRKMPDIKVNEVYEGRETEHILQDILKGYNSLIASYADRIVVEITSPVSTNRLEIQPLASASKGDTPKPPETDSPSLAHVATTGQPGSGTQSSSQQVVSLFQGEAMAVMNIPEKWRSLEAPPMPPVIVAMADQLEKNQPAQSPVAPTLSAPPNPPAGNPVPSAPPTVPGWNTLEKPPMPPGVE